MSKNLDIYHVGNKTTIAKYENLIRQVKKYFCPKSDYIQFLFVSLHYPISKAYELSAHI